MRVRGKIVYGKQVGRTLGFPTANLQPEGPLSPLPPNGVYAAWLYLDGGAARLPCVLNQGIHPTLPEGGPTFEAHALGFSGDLYGREAELEYLRFLRPERKFPSLKALQEQIQQDCQAARAYFDSLKNS